MRLPREIYQIRQAIETHLPHPSQPQSAGLALWVCERMALAMNPTPKGDRTTAIAISVLYRSCAIPAAWRIHHATRKGSWTEPTPTVKLLQALAPAVPPETTVIALCDRGSANPRLWNRIRARSRPRT